MQFTASQQKAIDKKDCSLLVSAGAGSGKTAVLTERIIQKLCDEKQDFVITDFLIVTFTKAAAGELSQRVRKKLSERALLCPDNKKILHNLALLPLAQISTINSFCYDLVRKNFQKLGLSPTVRVADDTEIEVLKNKIMNEVLEEAFEVSDDSFLAAYEIFASAKSDESFVTTLLNLDRNLSKLINREKYQKDVLCMYDEVATSNDFFSTNLGALIKDISKDVVMTAIYNLEKLCFFTAQSDDQLNEKYVPGIEQDIENAKILLDAIENKNYSDCQNLIHGYTLSKIGSLRNFENPALAESIRTFRKSAVDSIRNDLACLYSAGHNTVCACAIDCRRIIEQLFKLSDSFAAKFMAKKLSLGIIDFNDAEHLSLSLLTDSLDPFMPSDLAKQLSNTYKEIYIDEYQDVNELQDAIFRAICPKDKDQNENSRFLVGDIKQSIYRFRGARPDIFRKYRDDFHLANEDETNYGQKIFMQDNFRSSQSVIGLSNVLFKKLMGNNYEDGDFLIHSRSEQENFNSKKCNFTICSVQKDDPDFESTEQTEAYIIADKIKNLVNNPSELKSDGKPFTYSDICILTRSKDSLDVYESVLSSLGIPVFGDAGESFYGKKEILFMLCLLNSLDNPQRDIYLAGFMRSGIGTFTDDELTLIKAKFKKCSLYTSVSKYANGEDTDCDTQLSQKCGAFLDTLSYYRKLSRGTDAAKLIWQIYCDFDLLNVCASVSFGKADETVYASRRKNLLKLYDMARDFIKTSFKGIGDFIDYLNGSMDKNDIKADRIVDGNYVTLMSIHRSKGLEFPACFVCDLARGFNKSDEHQKLIFSDKHSMAIKLRDVSGLISQKSGTGNVVIDTPFRCALSKTEAKYALEEEIRILYVAITRARDRLYLTSCFKGDFAKLFSKCYIGGKLDYYSDCKNYLSMILSCVGTDKCSKIFADKASLSFDFNQEDLDKHLDCEFISSHEVFEKISSLALANANTENETVAHYGVDNQLLEEYKKTFSFTYPDMELCNIPSKLTISQLKKGLIDEEILLSLSPKRNYLTSPSFINSNDVKNGAKAGTAMHMFMQFADFDRCIKSGCDREADFLLQNGFIDKEQRSLIDESKLDEFFKTDFFKQIHSSQKIYREMRFNLCVDASELSSKIQRGFSDVLVQGVIDLFFLNSDNTFTVVDFKTDKVSNSNGEDVLIQRHSQQLSYYCRAVEEITGAKVSSAYIYSFSLMKPILVNL